MTLGKIFTRFCLAQRPVHLDVVSLDIIRYFAEFQATCEDDQE